MSNLGHTHQSNDLGQKQVRFICINGDSGPDQVSFRRIVGIQFVECLRTIVVALPCLAHQQSLACGRVLARLEMCCTAFGFGVAYYQCLVKLTHVWRSDPAFVYRVALNRFGDHRLLMQTMQKQKHHNAVHHAGGLCTTLKVFS